MNLQVEKEKSDNKVVKQKKERKESENIRDVRLYLDGKHTVVHEALITLEQDVQAGKKAVIAPLGDMKIMEFGTSYSNAITDIYQKILDMPIISKNEAFKVRHVITIYIENEFKYFIDDDPVLKERNSRRMESYVKVQAEITAGHNSLLNNIRKVKSDSFRIYFTAALGVIGTLLGVILGAIISHP